MKKIIPFLLILCFEISFSQDDAWNISTTERNNYTGIVLSNGRIGILPTSQPFGIKHIILNNVYDKASVSGVSRMLEGMNFGNLQLEIDGEKVTEANMNSWEQTLNMKDAVLHTSFQFKDKATVFYNIYALRNMPYTGYIDIIIKAEKTIQVKVTGGIQTPQEYVNPESTFSVHRDLETTIPILKTVANSKFEKHKVATSSTFIWHHVKKDKQPELKHLNTSKHNSQIFFEQKIEKQKTFEFAWTAATCTTQDFSDPSSESERFVISNLLTNKTDLLNKHKRLWERLWEGDIIIKGDLQSQLDVRLALYHLYAFGLEDSNLSIAPMGLSSKGYGGHIFWDAELWMYPPLLLLNHQIAESMLNYRFDRLEPAKNKALSYGYKGCMFPWESDDTGEEATPTWALTGTFEHHVTADVGIAFWNYYQITKNKKWLKQKGYPLLKEVADFWVSRASLNSDGSYTIKNVIGANEYAHNVTDNAFTNGAAITALRFAAQAAKALNIETDKNWEHIADNIKVHQFPNGLTKEHSQYNGEMIKQADVNLLAYPLNIIQDEKQIRKDLSYYEPKFDKKGPAMAQSILAVIYARLGDSENSFRLFKASYMPNKRAPFGALSESANSNNPYFVTAAGGMLQVVLFGFGGLHITDEGIIQKKPLLPKSWKSLTITGVGINKETFTVEQ
ncbi:glycosyl hydrolase family 95 catalytic domain-containing protein [Flavivirga eckloniae]|uniref:Glycosyl hydrolase family 65 n=1 Tax=Flavivirga eckloniae TaxID=1803846 RepID=A0A2K9PSN9_9FLAO|nr:glycoside hydrolase family 65 protein [Flavivirga eckloniae]AUP80081.1 glycosyl hydrolase family 65 [Flavivirga eckloniae]